MPKGVEHSVYLVIKKIKLCVWIPLMPKGVEHL